MTNIRSPAFAGSFYPAEADKLLQQLQQSFTSHPLGPQGTVVPVPNLLGGMVPHAGYVYSGPCAAHFYSRLERNVECVIVLGVNHQGTGSRASVSSAAAWDTPLGRVPVDRDLAEHLTGRVDFLTNDEAPHLDEHSIEVQLPFLQRVLGTFSFLPISLSVLSQEECRQLGRALASLYEEGGAMERKKAMIVASSDLNHYLSPRDTEKLDALALARLVDLDPVGLLTTVNRERISMCGVIPVAVMLFAALELGAKQARILKHCHSGDIAPMDEVVGYASVSVEGAP